VKIRFSIPLALATISIGLLLGTSASAQAFSVLYNFGTNAGDPSNPTLGDIVLQGRDGNLRGTTPNGGTGAGAMFKITPHGTLTVLHDFDFEPAVGVTLGTDGSFYGTSDGIEGGTVFKILPNGTLTYLYSFTGGDGLHPEAVPVQGTDGNFYGTTTEGGNSSNCYAGCGTVYKITPSGKLTTLYSFDKTHGEFPRAALMQGTDGNFYGTTQIGGPNDQGVVYKIAGSGKLTVLYNFDGPHGGNPISTIVEGRDGNFYGTTTGGGAKNSGVIFKITATRKFAVIHSLNGTTDGSSPSNGLVQATDGNLYGTTYNGGKTNQGTIFRIGPTKPYPYKVLYNFDGTTGAYPMVALLQQTNGILYGETYQGGTGDVNPCVVGQCGTFYSLNIGAGPFVSLISSSGKVGKTIEILGQGFKGTTGVSFNGTPATFTVVSGTYLTATVPTGATTGFVTVTTPKRKLKSNKKFRVL
jgi:uncharacterized repeat protein (TIGR03803 family)